MAQHIVVNVYEIDGIPVAVAAQSFPVAACKFRTYDGANTSLYGIIETQVTGVPKKFAVVQNVAALATLAG
jgi:hypothetical protein